MFVFYYFQHTVSQNEDTMFSLPCKNQINICVHLQVAILRYEGAPEVDPPLDVAYDLADRDGLVTTEFCILLFRTVLKKGKI